MIRHSEWLKVFRMAHMRFSFMFASWLSWNFAETDLAARYILMHYLRLTLSMAVHYMRLFGTFENQKWHANPTDAFACWVAASPKLPSPLPPKVCMEVAPTLQFSPLVCGVLWCVVGGSEMLRALSTTVGRFKPSVFQLYLGWLFEVSNNYWAGLKRKPPNRELCLQNPWPLDALHKTERLFQALFCFS